MSITSFLNRAGVITLLLGGAGAQGGTIYFIHTDADSTVGQQGANMSYDSRSGSTLTEGGNAGFSFTSSGSPNVSGLTSSFDQTSAQAPGSLSPFALVTASAYASADLASGSVRISGTGDITVSNNGVYGPGEASGSADLFDQLTFHVAGATASTVTPITVTYSFDGTSTVLSQSIGQETFTGFADVTSNLTFNNAVADYNFSTSNATPISTDVSGWASQTFSATPGLFTFQGVFDISGATFVMPISLSTSYACQAATCDYSHTGVIGLSLPGNVTYTSDSGVFLTQPLTESPEPSSWMLAIVSIAAGFALAARRSMMRAS
jgi:hypothetical protein